ncbi:uncharacterized protein LOC142591086 [Dermacentor variabilis]|uniref:uncharacterized protein LOC142591086 n=1 Tax=Dermacentor variabilis TaxID=34621 RepID=UPI003F5C2DC7
MFIIFVEIPDRPILFRINITEKTGGLAKLTGAQTWYRVIHYDNDTMVLADRVPGMWDKALCSLWTTEKYYRTNESHFPVATKAFYESNCKDAKYVPFPDTCMT